MTTNEDQKLKRKRGRPSPTAKDTAPTGYTGPSLDEILKLSEQEVAVAFDGLGVEASPFHWAEDDQSNVSRWHDYGMTMSDADRLKTQPKDKAGMQSLKASAWAIHQQGLRMALMAAHLQHWVDSLDDTQLIAEVERLSESRMSESEKRYSKVADLKDRVQQLVWPELVKASTLYVWPTNPLTGKVEDGRSRIPRPHDG